MKGVRHALPDPGSRFAAARFRIPTSCNSRAADPVLADPAMTAAPVEEDDDDFPWGLLGLLGLAGLMGLNRDRRDDTVRRP